MKGRRALRVRRVNYKIKEKKERKEDKVKELNKLISVLKSEKDIFTLKMNELITLLEKVKKGYGDSTQFKLLREQISNAKTDICKTLEYIMKEVGMDGV